MIPLNIEDLTKRKLHNLLCNSFIEKESFGKYILCSLREDECPKDMRDRIIRRFDGRKRFVVAWNILTGKLDTIEFKNIYKVAIIDEEVLGITL